MDYNWIFEISHNYLNCSLNQYQFDCRISLIVGDCLGSSSDLIFFERPKAVTQRCSVKKGVLRNLAKFTGKHLIQGLWHRCFSANFSKFLRTLFLTEHLQRLLLKGRWNLKLRLKRKCQIYNFGINHFSVCSVSSDNAHVFL